ncbi:hypothetical protein PG5_64970 [Pseudomonas sp. G5(2012)]|nr:hypothetical protein PG5_64970 [Pseudomonas sp. G5(2012)]
MLLLDWDHPVPVPLRKELFDGDCAVLKQLYGFDTALPSSYLCAMLIGNASRPAPRRF